MFFITQSWGKILEELESIEDKKWMTVSEFKDLESVKESGYDPILPLHLLERYGDVITNLPKDILDENERQQHSQTSNYEERLVIINPDWLSKQFDKIITAKSSLFKGGWISYSSLTTLFEPEFPLKSLLDIFHKSGLLFVEEISSSAFVPFHLDYHRPVEAELHQGKWEIVSSHE